VIPLYHVIARLGELPPKLMLLFVEFLCSWQLMLRFWASLMSIILPLATDRVVDLTALSNRLRAIKVLHVILIF
jgi:hypothetical protein